MRYGQVAEAAIILDALLAPFDMIGGAGCLFVLQSMMQ
jgi:hypothetical protein